MVDRALESSLESLAADRGITICFVDLSGAAEGLWLPEERTILLASGLSGRRAAEVLQHELEHVDIEDGHAALDAGVGHHRLGTTRWAVGATAAASLVLLLGVRAQLGGTPPPSSHPTQVAVEHSPSTAAAPPPVLTTSPPPTRKSGNELIGSRRVHTETVTVTAPPASTPGATGTVPRVVSSSIGPGVAGSSEPSSTTTTGGPTTTTTPPPTPDPTDTADPPTPTAAGTGAAAPRLAGGR